MATVLIDGIKYEAKAGDNLLQAVLSQALDLPYFCWHPSLGSVGACRQCAIIEYANADDSRGRLSMACMTAVRDGLRISINAAEAVDFRKTVIEWLMENHPHDCPVCEEGGECHLQDMTVMTGHSVRRFRGHKRTWRNQYLGPFIGHEMNRCITCYRCVRFYSDYAGGSDLGAFGSRGRMYFGRVEDGTLENEFSGNLVEVCPTGVFTDKPFAKQYTRKWDLQSAPSICTGCSVGCNTFASERYGVLRRIHNRYHGELNQYFLCDRGRFGAHFVNSEKRIRNAGISVGEGTFEVRGPEEAIGHAVQSLAHETPVVGIGSPRASFESNFALKQLVGEENFCNGMSDADAQATQSMLQIYQNGDIHIPSIAELELADAVLILGEDVCDTAPRAALAIRQAVRGVSFEMARDAGIPEWQDAGVRGHAQDQKSPMFIVSAGTTRLHDIATASMAAHPDEAAELGRALAQHFNAGGSGNALAGFAGKVAHALEMAQRPLVVCGASQENSILLGAVGALASALHKQGKSVSLFLSAREANSVGAALLGGALTMSEALARMSHGVPVIVLENDLYRRARHEMVSTALAASQAIVLDVLETPTAESAAVVFPAASFAESTGSYVNYETRAQRFYQTFRPGGEIAPAWEWLSRLAAARGDEVEWNTIDELTRACAQGGFAALAEIAPSSDYRFDGIHKISRQTHRYSGRTAMHADQTIHEPKAPVDNETPLSFSMEGSNSGRQASSAIPYVWSPGWNSNQSTFKFQQEVGGALLNGDPGARLLPGSELPQPLPGPSGVEPDGTGQYRAVALYPIFGGEEHSSASWPIARRLPAPFAVLHPVDAESLEVEVGQGVLCDVLSVSLEVRVDPGMPQGVVGISSGLPELGNPVSGVVDLVRDPDFVRRLSGEPETIARG